MKCILFSLEVNFHSTFYIHTLKNFGYTQF